jgi:hypothetical protein
MKAVKMSETEEKIPPIKTLHQFMFELQKEWSKFRNGAIIGSVSSGILFGIILWLIPRVRALNIGFIALVALIIAGVLLGYSIYALVNQYRFFNKWERRLDLLLQVEEQLLSRETDTKTQS